MVRLAAKLGFIHFFQVCSVCIIKWPISHDHQIILNNIILRHVNSIKPQWPARPAWWQLFREEEKLINYVNIIKLQASDGYAKISLDQHQQKYISYSISKHQHDASFLVHPRFILRHVQGYYHNNSYSSNASRAFDKSP